MHSSRFCRDGSAAQSLTASKADKTELATCKRSQWHWLSTDLEVEWTCSENSTLKRTSCDSAYLADLILTGSNV